ncbi:MAG: HD domain-containing protein [Candidatus Margulisbacteria bacterium]|nr:HD domain-containing protein [Candidatus Margulisiibacteriota bacterium]
MSEKEKIKQLLKRLKDKDNALYNHSLRVGGLVEKLLAQYRLPKPEKILIHNAALLHDIGKLDISDQLLTKEGRIDMDEYLEIQSHVEAGYTLLAGLDCFQRILPLIRHHHENVNGHGYPDNLKGDEIPLGSRIIHVVEAYDTMTNGRHTGKLSKKEALSELKVYGGRMYDEEVVKQFISMMTPSKTPKKLNKGESK